jgi:hypothetical protein
VLEAQLSTKAGALFLKALAAGLPEVSEAKPTGFKCNDVSGETSVPRVPIGFMTVGCASAAWRYGRPAARRAT